MNDWVIISEIDELCVDRMEDTMAWSAVVSAIVAAWSLDSLSKGMVIRKIGTGERRKASECLTLTNVRNEGGFNGMLSGRPKLLRRVSLAIIINNLIYAYRETRFDNAKDRPRCYWVFTGMYLGGALANVHERMKKGYVTDFAQLRYKCPFKKGALASSPIFNLADVFIVVGVIGTLIIKFFMFLDRLHPKKRV